MVFDRAKDHARRKSLCVGPAILVKDIGKKQYLRASNSITVISFSACLAEPTTIRDKLSLHAGIATRVGQLYRKCWRGGSNESECR